MEASSAGGAGAGGAGGEMPIERIMEAENIAEMGGNNAAGGHGGGPGMGGDDLRMHQGFVDDVGNHVTKRKMLGQLVAWAKHIPHFEELKKDDQVQLGVFGNCCC